MTQRIPLTPDQALERLQRVPEGGLEHVLRQIDLDLVVRRIAGGWVTHLFRGPARRELLDLLTRRVGELSPEMRARVLHAMRRLPLSPETSHAIRDAMVSLTGEPFNRMKHLLNSSGDHHDLEHVVFEHLLPEHREVVLAHIRREADASPSGDLRILCDIDDTVRSMLHERRWPRGRVYPGAVALLTALDRGAAAEPARPGDITFVTARPEGPQGIIEQYTRNGLSHLGLPPHSVMGGSFLNLFTKTSIKARKLQNFERERLLFPDCRKMFIGDSGQADALVGARMNERAPDFMAAVLIHDVAGVAATDGAELAASGVRLFDTYAGAAMQCLELGLITQDAANAIVAEVREAIAALPEGSGKRTLEEQLARELG